MAQRRGMSFTGMDGVVDDLAAANRAMDSVLDDLDDRLAPLSAAWTGEAAEAYRRARAQWDASARRRSALLSRIRATTSGVIDHHRAASAGVHGIWGADG